MRSWKFEIQTSVHCKTCNRVRKLTCYFCSPFPMMPSHAELSIKMGEGKWLPKFNQWVKLLIRKKLNFGLASQPYRTILLYVKVNNYDATSEGPSWSRLYIFLLKISINGKLKFTLPDFTFSFISIHAYAGTGKKRIIQHPGTGKRRP